MELNKAYEIGDEETSIELPNITNTVEDNTLNEVPINIDQYLDSINGIWNNRKDNYVDTLFNVCSLFLPIFYHGSLLDTSQHGHVLHGLNQTLLCDGNRTYTVGDSLHSTRCKLPRNVWIFTKNSTYSIVTEVCSM